MRSMTSTIDYLINEGCGFALDGARPEFALGGRAADFALLLG
jgi:hypothetical protein